MVECEALVPRASAYAVIKNRAGHLLMIRGAHGRLSLPGGGADPGETFSDTLRREVQEETGLKTKKLEHWQSYQNCVYFETEDIHYRVYLEVFMCEVENPEARLTHAGNPDDEGVPEWVDLRTVKDGELQNVFGGIVRALKNPPRHPTYADTVMIVFAGVVLPSILMSAIMVTMFIVGMYIANFLSIPLHQ
jgi:8-oxo-dGTP pyrophosphatase MutT (NUDIX family)